MINGDEVDVSLAWQPIFNWAGDIVKLECLSRFYYQGKQVNTYGVLTDIKEFGMAQKFDELVVKTGLHQVCEEIDKSDVVYDAFIKRRVQIAFNLQPATLLSWAGLTDSDCTDDHDYYRPLNLISGWLDKFCPILERSQLGFELLENGCIQESLKNVGYTYTDEDVSMALFDILHYMSKAGFKVLIDDFGAQQSNAFRLGLSASSIKVDGMVVKYATMPEDNAHKEWGMRIIASALSQIIFDLPHTPSEVVLEHICDHHTYDEIRNVVKNRCGGENLDDFNKVLFQGFYLGEPSHSLQEALLCEP